MPVFLYKRPNHMKSALLAPFVARYRSRLELRKVTDDLVQIVAQSVAMTTPKAFFAKNYKAACSTVSHAIHFWETGTPCTGDIHVTPQLKQGLGNYRELVDAITDPASRKFSFVRDPQARAVSAFTNFFVDQSNEGRHKHKVFLPASMFDETVALETKFDFFLDYVESCVATDASFSDPHFRPQFYNIRPDILQYDLIGRVETLDEDLKSLEEILQPRWRLPETQRGAARNVSRRKFIPSDRQLARIREIYAPDYHWFGYD